MNMSSACPRVVPQTNVGNVSGNTRGWIGWDAKFNRIYWAKHVLFNVVLTMFIPQVRTPGDGRYRTHRDSTPQVANINNLSPGGPVVKV